MGTPLGVTIKGISGKGGVGSGRVWGGQAELLEGPEASGPLGLCAVVVAGMSSSCFAVVTSTLLM